MGTSKNDILRVGVIGPGVRDAVTRSVLQLVLMLKLSPQRIHTKAVWTL